MQGTYKYFVRYVLCMPFRDFNFIEKLVLYAWIGNNWYDLRYALSRKKQLKHPVFKRGPCFANIPKLCHAHKWERLAVELTHNVRVDPNQYRKRIFGFWHINLPTTESLNNP